MNVVVIAVLIVSSRIEVIYIDTLAAVMIAAYILWGAWKIGKRSFDHLMDREFETSDRLAIERIVNSHPDSRGIHELRTRHSGNRSFIQFHLDLDHGLSLKEAHDISDDISDKISNEFPDSEVLIHHDPV